MSWLEEAIERLAERPVCGYRDGEKPAVEPTALTALALLSADRGPQAATALAWLLQAQSPDGSLGVNAETRRPCWPTGWAALAWKMGEQALPDDKNNNSWADAADRAVVWMISNRGRSIPDTSKNHKNAGHDPTLQGWPWVDGTHSWVEPTAINVLALHSAGRTDHPHYREAIELLLDRQLPNGGWNFGNTVVFGNALRPHIEPTGLTLAALADEAEIRPKVQPAIDLLGRTLSEQTTTVSLCYALLGLSQYDALPPSANDWLSVAHRRTMAAGGSPYHLALLVLAGKCQRGCLWKS